MTHGKCTRCKVVFRWKGRPQLRSAMCPSDTSHGMLARTAARLVTSMPIVDEHPFELVPRSPSPKKGANDE